MHIKQQIIIIYLTILTSKVIITARTDTLQHIKLLDITYLHILHILVQEHLNIFTINSGFLALTIWRFLKVL